MMRKTILFSLIVFLPLFAYPQKPPFKFGKIDKEDLEMTVYEKDTTAAAVVLCEYGYFNSNSLRFTRWLRVKILKKDGLSWGNRVFNTGNRAAIKGYTYNLIKGKVEREKLKNKSVYKVQVSDMYFNTRVAMPNVKVGSVIDIRFSHTGLPSEWHFQYKVPVKHSELRIDAGDKIGFQKNFFGFEDLDINERGRWVAKDVPAFVEEPFMNSSSNYVTKFEFDIRYIVIDGIERPISSTWEVMCDNLLDVNTLGGVLRMDGYMSRIAKDIELTANTESEKIKAAFDEVKKIKWNGNHSLYTDQLNIKFVHKEKIGNSAEINIALIQLLRNMGLEAYPVALSTRENGILSPASPSYQKLNHVIAYVKGENKNYLLDATEDYMPYDLLPVKDLNWKGRLLNRENLCWMDLAPEKKAKTQTFMKLKIEDDLSVEGEVNYRHYDYAASNFRKKYHEFNSEEEFIRDMTENREGLKIRSCSFDNLEELNKPVSENYDVVINNKLLDTGDECLLYPFFFEQIETNPFKVEKRQYPVDFAYQRENMMIVQLTIPEGYEISEIPESVQMQMEESACQLVYQIGKNQNMITLSYQMNINKELFLPEEYPDLREFYNQIIKIQSQPIVLKKI